MVADNGPAFALSQDTPEIMRSTQTALPQSLAPLTKSDTLVRIEPAVVR